MKIRQLHLRNFRGFASATFTFHDRFTVLIGDNATGKTSVLDALAVALGSFFIDLEKIASRPIREEEVRISMIDGQPRPQLPVSVAATGEISGQTVTWKRELKARNTTAQDARALRDIARRYVADSRDGVRVIFPVIAYHGTGRLWAEHEKIGFQKQEEGIRMAYTNCLSAKSSSKEFLSWYKTLEDSVAKFKDELDISHLQAFKQAVLGLMPDGIWQDLVFDRKREELVGLFRDPQGTVTRLSYRQLSDGYRNFIGMAADVAYRCIQLNPHLRERAVLDTPGVVLIDELDLHLHPSWQRRIVADLKRIFPQVQFIATTHSPFIVQSLASDELISLGRAVDAAPKDLSLHQVSQWVMGVESLFSRENATMEAASRSILSRLDEDGDPDQIGAEIEQISDPGVRAMLSLAKMAKGK